VRSVVVVLAVAASFVTAVCFMLKHGTAYTDLGADHFVPTDHVKMAHRLLCRLAELDVDVGEVRDKKTAA
jgi:hypothetical protein